jgi:mono/diheme cytochrome c family protein
VLFQYHCNDCHAARRGYSAVAPLIRGRDRQRLCDLIVHLDEAHFFMPPWAGTAEEAELLADYLLSIAPPRPKGMAHGPVLSAAERKRGGQ